MRKFYIGDERATKMMVQQMKCYSRPCIALPHGPHITDALLMHATQTYANVVGRPVIVVTVKSGLKHMVVLDLDGEASRRFLESKGVNPDDPNFYPPGDPRHGANRG